jgi:hypothetical protein
MQTQLPPPQRGTTDGSIAGSGGTGGAGAGGAGGTTTPPPPPVDAGVDLPRPPVDAGMPIDRPPDIVTVVDAAPDVPLIRCTANTAMCPDGMYCSTPACGNNGTCVAVPSGNQQAPVCGCDRLTYWNTSLAATTGTSVRAEGACAAGAVTSIACGGLQNANCPAPALCNLEQASNAACNANAAGRCWMLPAACPPLGAGMMPTTRRCVGGGANPACQSACDLIRMERVYTTDATCP